MTPDNPKLQLAKDALVYIAELDEKLTIANAYDTADLMSNFAAKALALLNAPDADKFWWQDADLKLPEYENRKKIDEWEACYASLFRKMNQICSKQKSVEQGELSEAGLEAAIKAWQDEPHLSNSHDDSKACIGAAIKAYNKTKGKRDE